MKCFEDIAPFGISNEELLKTNQGSKNKFTVLEKNRASPSSDLISQLNGAINGASYEAVFQQVL